MLSKRLLLADDHRLFVEGVRHFLEGAFAEIRIVHDGRELLEEAARFRPDMVILDISMPRLNGLEAARSLRQNHPAPRMIFLSMHSEPAYLAEAIRAGARGYVLKQSTKDELLKAVSEVLQGRTFITPLVDPSEALLADREESGFCLTARQREVLQLAAEGRTAKEIAAALNISPRTADFHKNRIMQSLRLHNTAELTRYAIKHRLIEA